MEARRQPRPAALRLLWRFAVAVAMVGVATVIQYGLRSLLPPSPHLFYYPAVVFAAWKEGLEAALLAVTLSAVAIAFFFLAPQWHLAIAAPKDRLDLAIFVAMGGLVSFLVARSRAATARFRLLFDKAMMPAALTDMSGRFVACNDALCAMLGYSADELRRLSLGDLGRDHGRGASSMLRQVRSESANGKFRADEEEEEEKETEARPVYDVWRSKDGTAHDVEVASTTLRLAIGERSLVQINDVTSRIEAEKERDRERARLRLVLDEVPVAVVMVGADGHIELTNPLARELLGLGSPGALAGRAAPPDPTREGALFGPGGVSAQALMGRHVSEELALERADGSAIPALVNAIPYWDATGKVEGAIVAFQDISTVKEVERLRKQWNALVAHDLRNALQVIVASTDILTSHVDVEPFVLGYVGRIRRAARRLDRMVQDLLDSSRIEANELPLVKVDLDLVDAVREAVVEVSGPDAQTDVDVHVTGPVPHVLGDGGRIAQVLGNLLSNALKYRAPGSRVDVEVTSTCEAVGVSVTNRGPGISAAEQPHVFERFRRSDSAVRAGIEGVGVGLYIARGLVEAHGEHIACESIPGETTTFRFTLPLPKANRAS